MAIQLTTKAHLLFDEDDTTHTISGFTLPLGNNYTISHLVDALFECEDGLKVVDLIYNSEIGEGDTITFEYKGSYGNHKDSFVMCDLMDYLRPAMKLYDSWEAEDTAWRTRPQQA